MLILDWIGRYLPWRIQWRSVTLALILGPTPKYETFSGFRQMLPRQVAQNSL